MAAQTGCSSGSLRLPSSFLLLPPCAPRFFLQRLSHSGTGPIDALLPPRHLAQFWADICMMRSSAESRQEKEGQPGPLSSEGQLSRTCPAWKLPVVATPLLDMKLGHGAPLPGVSTAWHVLGLRTAGCPFLPCYHLPCCVPSCPRKPLSAVPTARSYF